MPEIIIQNSTISGLHATRKSCHQTITVHVVPDQTGKDPDAMKVVVPTIENLEPECWNMITWPICGICRRLRHMSVYVGVCDICWNSLTECSIDLLIILVILKPPPDHT
jgi:hypothetical protein